MVHFMYQPDWTTGHPDIWLSCILSVSMRVVGDMITIIRRLNIADGTPQRGQATSSSVGAWKEQKAEQDRICSLSDGERGFILPLDSDGTYTIDSPGLQAFRLHLLGLLSLHNHVSQLIVTLSFPFSMCVCIYIHTSICVCTHTNTKTHPICSIFFLFGEPNKYFHKLSLIFKITT